MLWLSFAFLINKAPNYTRLLITLPFVAYFVAVATRFLAGRVQLIALLPTGDPSGPIGHGWASWA